MLSVMNNSSASVTRKHRFQSREQGLPNIYKLMPFRSRPYSAPKIEEISFRIILVDSRSNGSTPQLTLWWMRLNNLILVKILFMTYNKVSHCGYSAMILMAQRQNTQQTAVGIPVQSHQQEVETRVDSIFHHHWTARNLFSSKKWVYKNRKKILVARRSTPCLLITTSLTFLMQ